MAVTILLAITPAAADAVTVCLIAAKSSSNKQDCIKTDKKKRKRSDGDDDGKDIGPVLAESEWGTGEKWLCP